MPQKKLIECTVFVVDCSSDISEKLKYIYRHASTKYFTGGRDSNYMLFFNNGGSRTTEIIRGWSDYNLHNLNDLGEKAIDMETTYSPVELADALQTAIEVSADDATLKNHFKRILLLSDFKQATEKYEMSELEKKINEIRKGISETNIWMYMLGPEVKLPKLSCPEDIVKFAHNIEPAEHLDDNRKILIKQFSKIFDSTTSGVMCDYETGFHLLFSYYQKRATRYPYYVDLSIGSNIRIPVQISSLTRNSPIIKKHLCFHDTEEPDLAKNFYEKKSHEVVSDEDVVSGYQYHKKRVILTKEQEESLKDDSSLKCLSICAFVDASEIRKELYLMSRNMNIIVPDPRKTESCQRDLCAFLQALRKKNVIAIAKRVYNNKFRPWPFAIFACEDHENCLLMGKLPFKHEFHEKFIQGKEVKLFDDSSDENREYLYKFLDNMTAKKDDFCDNGKVLHPLAEHLCQNPNRAFKYEYLVMKYLDMVPQREKELKVHDILLDRSEPLVDELLQRYVDKETEDEDD